MNDHLNALRLRLSNERGRRASAIAPGEIKVRDVWIAQIEREIANEVAREAPEAEVELSDEELLRELGQ